jgi:hypothetical protein
LFTGPLGPAGYKGVQLSLDTRGGRPGRTPRKARFSRSHGIPAAVVFAWLTPE